MMRVLRNIAGGSRNAVYVAAGLLVIGFTGWRVGVPLIPAAPAATAAAPPAYIAARALVFFSPQECATMLQALRGWNSLHRVESLDVEGLVYGKVHENSINKIINGVGLEFPVRVAPARDLARYRSHAGYGEGAFVVLVDRAGRIRFTAPLEDAATPQLATLIPALVQSLKGGDAQVP